MASCGDIEGPRSLSKVAGLKYFSKKRAGYVNTEKNLRLSAIFHIKVLKIIALIRLCDGGKNSFDAISASLEWIREQFVITNAPL